MAIKLKTNFGYAQDRGLPNFCAQDCLIATLDTRQYWARQEASCSQPSDSVTRILNSEVLLTQQESLIKKRKLAWGECEYMYTSLRLKPRQNFTKHFITLLYFKLALRLFVQKPEGVDQSTFTLRYLSNFLTRFYLAFFFRNVVFGIAN